MRCRCGDFITVALLTATLANGFEEYDWAKRDAAPCPDPHALIRPSSAVEPLNSSRSNTRFPADDKKDMSLETNQRNMKICENYIKEHWDYWDLSGQMSYERVDSISLLLCCDILSSLASGDDLISRDEFMRHYVINSKNKDQHNRQVPF